MHVHNMLSKSAMLNTNVCYACFKLQILTSCFLVTTLLQTSRPAAQVLRSEFLEMKMSTMRYCQASQVDVGSAWLSVTCAGAATAGTLWLEGSAPGPVL